MKKRFLSSSLDFFLQIACCDYISWVIFAFLLILSALSGDWGFGGLYFFQILFPILPFIPGIFIKIFGQFFLSILLMGVTVDIPDVVLPLDEIIFFLPICIIYIFIFFSIQRLFARKGGRNLGKKIFKLIVVTLEGEEIDKKRALERNKCKWFVIWFWWIYLIRSLKERKNIFYSKETGLTYWDKKSGTNVITIAKFRELNEKKIISN